MSACSDDGSDEIYDSDAVYDSDDEGAYPAAQTSAQKIERTLVYESLGPDRVQQLIDDDIARVCAIIGLEHTTVAVLLWQFRWNQDRLIERYMDAPDDVLRAAGEPLPAPPAATPSMPPAKRARRGTRTDTLCPVCFDTPADVFELRCQHRFCTECWTAYVTAKIKDEGKCTIACMSEGCKTLVDEPAIARLVDGACYDRWKELLQQAYVSAHPTLRFCPHPACRETVSCASATGSALLTTVPTVACAAAHTFCFGCGADAPHAPLICALATRWLKSAREDAGTQQWINANTRRCPKCANVIEKSGGCNRMSCGHCQYMFCWLCMKKWDTHGYNDKVCAIWKEPDPDVAMSDAKRNLERWLFYFDRFNNHELSATLDEALCERTAETIEKVQTASGMSWIEAQFMRQAVEELTRCRATLKWTYAMAHFLVQGNQKEIFEDVQADLEQAVEKLSQLLQEEIEEDTVAELRRNIMDQTVYVQKRHEIVLEDTASRLHDGVWQWTVPLD